MSDYNSQLLDDLDAPQGQPVRYAGFWLRFAAYFIDGIILQVVAILIYLISGSEILSPELIPQLVVVIFNFGYFIVMESSDKQATLGKMAVGIYVTDTNGQRISPGKAALRIFGKFLSVLTLFIGFIMAGFTEHKQALHDMIANTLVVRK